MNRLHWFLILSIWPFVVHAQFVDSLKMHLSHQPSFLIRLDNRNTFVRNRTARVNGLDVGLSYNKRFCTGISFNQLTSSVYRQEANDISSHFAISYISYFVDYTYYQKKRIAINMPLHLGIGMSYFYARYSGQLHLSDKHFGITYEASTIFTYSVFYWFSISGGFGYRLALFNDAISQNQLTAIIYSFGINFYPDKIYKRLTTNLNH